VKPDEVKPDEVKPDEVKPDEADRGSCGRSLTQSGEPAWGGRLISNLVL
jgi:hypothetical protein